VRSRWQKSCGDDRTGADSRYEVNGDAVLFEDSEHAGMSDATSETTA
jgi:hypothetical protein